MIMKPSDYETAASYDTDAFGVPAGGYVCEIKNLEYITTKTGKPQMKASLDIAEGEYAGYFLRRYKAAQANGKAKWQCAYTTFVETPDGGTNPYYKGFISATQKSNPDFIINWAGEPAQFRGKKIGMVFGEEEFIGNDGRKHVSVKPVACRNAEAIRNGDFRVPARKTLDDASGVSDTSDTFTPVPADDDLPF